MTPGVTITKYTFCVQIVDLSGPEPVPGEIVRAHVFAMVNDYDAEIMQGLSQMRKGLVESFMVGGGAAPLFEIRKVP